MKERLWLALRLPELPLLSFPAHPVEQAVCVLEKKTSRLRKRSCT